jgi:hypothetical protein
MGRVMCPRVKWLVRGFDGRDPVFVRFPGADALLLINCTLYRLPAGKGGWVFLRFVQTGRMSDKIDQSLQ